MIRLGLVLLFLVLFVLVLGAMRLGWRRRAATQSGLPPLAELPGSIGDPLVPDLAGLYVGTTFATQWQNRVVVHGLGLRSEAVFRLFGDGVLIDRTGSEPIYIPNDELIDARLEPALAGKVVGPGGLLVLRWQHGAAELDTGVRADDRSGYAAWIASINNDGARSRTGPSKDSNDNNRTDA
ncbi:MAG: hypothetical protein JWN95_746 [Frankiales bacterium]|nr:hypothetical protein [Frankiales bacterium]